MGDYYTEQLVKKNADGKDMVTKAVLIGLTVLSVAVVFVLPVGLILPIIMIVLDVFMFRRLDVEYEYLYVNGDLDIDKIMHKEKRKTMLTMNVNDMEILAPSGSAELFPHKNAKTYNFTSRQAGAKTYELVYMSSGEKKKIIFEPNKEIIDGIWMMAPRKVIK